MKHAFFSQAFLLRDLGGQQFSSIHKDSLDMAGLGDKLVLSRTVPISRRILEDAFSSRLMGQSWKKDGEGSKVWGLCASRMQRNRTVSIVRHFSAKISKYTSGKNEAQRSRNIAIIHYR